MQRFRGWLLAALLLLPAIDGFAAGTSLTVVSLNLAHGRKDNLNQMLTSDSTIRENLGEIAQYLKQSGADVIALQEADGPSRWSGNFNHVELLSQQSDYPHYVLSPHAELGIGRYKFASYGTAFLSRRSFQHTLSHSFAPSPPTAQKGLTLVEIEWPDQEGTIRSVDLVSVHLDFSRTSVRQAQLAEISLLINARQRPTILMGDFNSEWLTQALMQKELQQRHFHTYLNPLQDLTTYKNKRLDWILISQEFEFVDYRTEQVELSDHKPVLAEIRWRMASSTL